MYKQIGILTGGGDAPGLNAAIRAVVRTAIGEFGMTCIGIEDSFEGILGETHTMKLTPKTGLIVAAGMVRDEDTVMMMNTKGTIIRIPANQINKLGRTTQGVTLMRFAEDEQVATMTIARAKDGDASMNGVDPDMILQGDA